MSDAFIPLSAPLLAGNELRYVTECIQTGWVSSAGPFVTRFENGIAARLQSPQAVACVNGTAALHLALVGLGVRADDEILVPTVTFIAAVNVVRYVGAHPVFMDCDEYLNIDADKVRAFLTHECRRTPDGVVNQATGRRVAGIMVVHVFGHPANLAPILDVAREYNVRVIEDATEAIGSCYQTSGAHCGILGDLGCLSFNGNKLITTGGGGMLLARDAGVAEHLRYLSTQAKDDPLYFRHHEVGYNYRLTNLQAAVGVAQLEQLDEFIRIKRANFAKYRELLSGDGLRLIAEPPQTTSNYWHYALVVESGRELRDHLVQVLRAARIEARPLWDLVHEQPPYRECQSYQVERAGWYRDRVLNIPCSVSLCDDEITRVTHTIRGAHARH